jgi:hypothetical protein
MKVIRSVAVAGLVALMLSGAAMAQTLNHKIQANIPFRFAVGGKVLPAGSYTLSFGFNDRNVVMLQDNQGHGAFLMGVPNAESNTKASVLVFRTKDGELYALESIKSPLFGIGFDVNKSLANVARDGSTAEAVTLVAQLVK